MYVYSRYRGKQSPDAILAEICWRAKNLFEDAEYEKRLEAEPMEVDNESRLPQGEEFESYADSDGSSIGDNTHLADFLDADDDEPAPKKSRK